MSASLKIGDVTIPGRVLTAPMTGVSDLPFRRIASRCGAAYVATEMVACDSFARGRPDVVRRAAIGAKEDEHALGLMVIQLVGRTPEWVAKGAQLAEQAGADIIDFNMGCPAKEVTGALSGSALMREPELAALAERLGVKAITVHGRTRQQFYSGQADWRAVAEVKKATSLPLIVNGDIIDAMSARMALEQSGADAVMIGRGAYGRPWIAAALDRALHTGDILSEPSLTSRLGIVLEHFTDTLRFYGDALGLKIFRKHLGWYVEQALCPADPALRRAAKARLCQIDNPSGVESALTELWAALSPDSALPILVSAHM